MYNFLLIIALYLPFQLALNPTGGIDLASIRVLILILFFAWLARGLKNKKIIIGKNSETWLILSFLFLDAFSAIVAKNTDWSERKMLFLLSIFPVYFVVSALVDSREKMIRLIKFLVVGGFGVALIGIGQFFSQFVFGFEKVFNFWAHYVIVPFLGNSFGLEVLQNPSWLVNISGKTYLRATSLFPDPHMFAFYLGLLLPLAAYLAIYSNRKRLFSIMAGGIFLADVLTFSRGGYVGLFVGLLFFGLFWWRRIGRKYKIAGMAVLSICVAALLVPSPISQRFLSSFNLKEGSNRGRLEMWGKAYTIILEKPWLGTGLGNYPLAVSPTVSYRNSIYAHNTYLDIAVETGVANGLVWIGILSAAFYGFWRKAKEDRLFFFLAASLVIFAAHSVVETAIYSPVVLTLFLIIIGFNAVQNEKT